MSRGRFLDNPSYGEYVRHLLRLHSLMAAGRGDSAEADAVREEMLVPWRRLDPDELARVDGLSADLYMLTGEEIFAAAEPAERTRSRLEPRLHAAWAKRDWDEVLALLRTGPDFLTPDRLAYLRGRCWAELGHPDVALLFFDHASRLSPGNLNYRALALEPLLQLGQLDEARQRAHAFSVDLDAHLGLRV
jgi:hypothetical protein